MEWVKGRAVQPGQWFLRVYTIGGGSETVLVHKRAAAKKEEFQRQHGFSGDTC